MVKFIFNPSIWFNINKFRNLVTAGMNTIDYSHAVGAIIPTVYVLDSIWKYFDEAIVKRLKEGVACCALVR